MKILTVSGIIAHNVQSLLVGLAYARACQLARTSTWAHINEQVASSREM